MYGSCSFRSLRTQAGPRRGRASHDQCSAYGEPKSCVLRHQWRAIQWVGFESFYSNRIQEMDKTIVSLSQPLFQQNFYLGFLRFFFREGNGSPLQYSCLENSMDGGAWWAAIHGVTKRRTRLNNSHTHTHTRFFLILKLNDSTQIPNSGHPTSAGFCPAMGALPAHEEKPFLFQTF